MSTKETEEMGQRAVLTCQKNTVIHDLKGDWRLEKINSFPRHGDEEKENMQSQGGRGCLKDETRKRTRQERSFLLNDRKRRKKLNDRQVKDEGEGAQGPSVNEGRSFPKERKKKKKREG